MKFGSRLILLCCLLTMSSCQLLSSRHENKYDYRQVVRNGYQIKSAKTTYPDENQSHYDMTFKDFVNDSYGDPYSTVGIEGRSTSYVYKTHFYVNGDHADWTRAPQNFSPPYKSRYEYKNGFVSRETTSYAFVDYTYRSDGRLLMKVVTDKASGKIRGTKKFNYDLENLTGTIEVKTYSMDTDSEEPESIQVRHIQYDQNERIIRIRYPGDSREVVADYVYDDFGNMVQSTLRDESGNLIRQQNYEYVAVHNSRVNVILLGLFLTQSTPF